MDVSFLTPQGAALGLAVVVPLSGLLWVERRARRIRASLGVREPRLRTRLPETALLCTLVALLALAAAQPVLATQRTQAVRTDAEASFGFDISRSMLAAHGRAEPTRLERAKSLGLELRRRLSDVPVGIASFTDRVLPHLFPTSDQATFAATLARAVDVEHPPPAGYDVRATTLGALATVASTGFFSAPARRRLLVVFTDGETRPVFPARFAAALRRPPGIKLLFVQTWGADERIYTTGLPDPGYLPDPTSTRTITALAAASGGRVFSEGELDRAARAARTYVGGPGTSTADVVRGRRALAPYVLGLAFLPLSLLLWRRNGPSPRRARTGRPGPGRRPRTTWRGRSAPGGGAARAGG
jgi:hypothetical protein